MMSRSGSWSLQSSSANRGASAKKYSLSSLTIRVALFSIISVTVIYVILSKSDFASQLDRVFASLESDTNRFEDVLIPAKVNITRNITVHTESGPLEGFVQSFSGRQLATFLGVPYARPPIGKLRFRPTEPVERWTTLKRAHSLPPPCVQPEYTQKLFPVHILSENISEDCLYLNIWSPLSVSGQVATNATRKSVMVYIHGGLFTIGSIGVDEYDGKALAALGDVIVVSIQYRLGVYGFLDLDHDLLPGNMGLLDQVQAFKWVQENIIHFGGDPNSVTLFGTSAGSISIGFHMFSSRASSLFHRVILQSGSPALLRQVYSRGESVAEKFATALKCYHATNGSSVYDDSDQVVACLESLSSESIQKVQSEFVQNNPVPFMPTIPSDYIETSVLDANDSQPLYQHEALLGFNLNEGALMLHLAYPQAYTRTTVPKLRKLKDVHKKVTEMGVDSGMTEAAAETMSTLLIKGNNEQTPEEWAGKMADLFSDMMFVCPTYQFADLLLRRNVSTHLYLFGQRALSSPWGEWMGVTHHDEIVYIFGYPLRYPQLFSDNDRQLSQLMIKVWSHFAKTGQIAQAEFDHKWTPYNSNNHAHMRLDMKRMQVGYNFHNESCDLYSLLADYLA